MNITKTLPYHFIRKMVGFTSYLKIFLTDKDLSQLDRDSYFSQIGRNIRDIEENSLVRSGLMLSGVNNVLQGKQSASDDNDGLLTTLEISTLDLKDIDMWWSLGSTLMQYVLQHET